MSRKPDDLELDYIHQLAKSNQKVQDLIQDKNNAAIELENRQYSKFKKHEPVPKPNNDISLAKIYTTKNMDDKTLSREVQKSHAKHDQQIKQQMDALVEHPNHAPIKHIVQEMNAKDIATISEKGGEVYKEMKEIEEKEIKDSLRFDLDDSKNFKEYSLNDMFLDNSKDIDKSPSPADDFE
ncbi:MAG: hypothetical protein AAGC64_04560 [Bacteroidota bacterium]